MSIKLFVRTLSKWQKDDCLLMGAALAFYALFSLFPLLMVLVSVSGLLLGPNTNAFYQILAFFQTSFPPEATEVVEEILVNLNQNSLTGGLIGSLLLLLTASTVFAAISRSVDKIWAVDMLDNERLNWLTAVMSFINRKILSFILVIGVVVVLMTSQLLDIGSRILLKILEDFSDFSLINNLHLIDIDTILLWQGLQLGFSYFLVYLLFLVLFKIIPCQRIAWSDVWLGAFLTASLFVSLEQLVSQGIIQIGSRFQSYGLIGGVMILLFWLYLVCQLFLLGSVFTYVYAHNFGSCRR